MQKIKNKKYYTKHLSSPSDVRDLGKHGLWLSRTLTINLGSRDDSHTLWWTMDDGGGWWCYGGGGWWMKCERGGVPRDEREWSQAPLFIGWTEGWTRPRVRWTRPRARLTFSLFINCNCELQLMRLLYFHHAPVPAGHGPVVGNGSFYWFVFSAASWARPRVRWTRGVFRLCFSALCLGRCRWGSGRSTFIPFLVFMLELVVFLLLLWFWAHFILKIQKEDKNTLFPTLVLKKG